MAATYSGGAITSISGSPTPAALFLQPNMIDWTRKVRLTDSPFLEMIGRGKAPSTPAVKLEWGVSYPDAVSGQLNGAISSTSATSWVVDDASIHGVGDVLYIESEAVLVTAVDEATETLTVSRGFGGTTAATHVDNMTYLILPSAIAENQLTPLGIITQGEKDHNFFKQSEVRIDLSHRAEVIPTQETLSLKVNDRLAAEIRKKMEDTIPDKLEYDLLFGPRAVGTTSVPSSMGGILTTSSFIGNTNTSLSGPLTWGQIMNELQDTYVLVGKRMGMTAMAHPTVCRIVSSFFEDTRRTSGSDTKITTYWKEFDTDFGVLKLVPNRKMLSTAASALNPLSRILFFNPDDIEFVPLSGDSGWSMEPIDVSDRWAKAVAVRGDHTMKAKNPDTRTLIGGFSVVTSDYAGLS